MKALLISLIAGAAGIASTLAGLAWDAWLHAADPTLAEREGIFTLANPGHALLGLGVLLTCVGLLSALHIAWGMAKPRGFLGKPYVRTLSMRLSALVSAGAVVFALAVSSGGHEHAHADEAHVQAHTEDTPAMASEAAVSDEAHAHTDGSHTAAETADGNVAAGGDTLGAATAPTHASAGDDQASVSPHSAEMSRGAGGTSDGHHHDAVDATPEEIACGNQLVRDTQAATARFADINVALAEGYRNNPDKPGATHYGNPAYKRDGKVMDLARPESLIYYTNPTTGESALLGALFTMPQGEDGPQPCGAVTSWHTHAACGNRATGELIPVEPGTACAGGYRYGESVQMMHVWFVPGRKNGVAPVS